MVDLLYLFYFLHRVQIFAGVKASLFTLIVIYLSADDDFSFMRGKCENSVVLPGYCAMQLCLLQYFQPFDRAILNQNDKIIDFNETTRDKVSYTGVKYIKFVYFYVGVVSSVQYTGVYPQLRIRFASIEDGTVRPLLVYFLPQFT